MFRLFRQKSVAAQAARDFAPGKPPGKKRSPGRGRPGPDAIPIADCGVAELPRLIHEDRGQVVDVDVAIAIAVEDRFEDASRARLATFHLAASIAHNLR